MIFLYMETVFVVVVVAVAVIVAAMVHRHLATATLATLIARLPLCGRAAASLVAAQKLFKQQVEFLP